MRWRGKSVHEHTHTYHQWQSPSRTRTFNSNIVLVLPCSVIFFIFSDLLRQADRSSRVHTTVGKRSHDSGGGVLGTGLRDMSTLQRTLPPALPATTTHQLLEPYHSTLHDTEIRTNSSSSLTVIIHIPHTTTAIVPTEVQFAST